jgi:succinate-semialdehyde dehydrogenase/glutarate-semialdehyde dehydrogenase
MSEKLIQSVPTGLFIGGQWLDAGDGGRIEVDDPATEEIIASVASATVEDATLAVDAAFAAGKAWAKTAPRERAEILRAAFELITARRDDIAVIMSREEGKTMAEGLGEVAYAAEFFRWYAEEAPRTMGHFGRSPAGLNNILVDHAPVGVSLLITPWNFPAAMATRKIAPALAAGCTVIFKPASATPLTALLVGQLLQEAGVPDGVVNVLPSKQSGKVCARMLEDDRVRKVSFTGSTEVGKILLAKAAETVVNCSMELGGNAPVIVLDDADMDVAIEGSMVAKMRNAGESCIAANRFYVHSSIKDEFAERFAAEMNALTVGPGLEEGVDVGPLVDAQTRDEVAALVDDAVANGGKVLAGGKSPDRPGYFYEPTVISDVGPDAKILRTEVFGPVAPIVAFDDVDDVIEKANDTEFGLVSYVFGSTGRALAVAQRIDSGMVGVNRGFISDPAAPFGGMKQSGIGREGSQDGIHEFLEKKYIAVEW